jgi:hypothetical protein
MARERWEDVIAYYRTYISIIQPLLQETRREVLNLTPDDIINTEILKEILKKEIKRSVSKVKAISEFNAFFRKEIFNYIIEYIEEIQDQFTPIDIKDYIMDFLEEAISAFDLLLDIVKEDQSQQHDSILFKLYDLIAGKIFPQGKNLQEIYDQLLDNAQEWYEVQRYILQPTTFYRDDIGEMIVPGISPKQFQVINQMTSLFNLDPNYMDMEHNPDNVIPTIMISDIFDPYISNIANTEEESIKRICQRMEMDVIMDIFIGPSDDFLKLTEPHNFITSQQDPDGKTRWMPQFSNETLFLLYLSHASYRRGFLSKELINWISINFAFIIYNAILHTQLSDENILYNLFLDLKTEEKILPYLMKLLCYGKYLRLDRTKIRDSPTYRKEIFNFLGSKIEAIDKMTYFLVDELKKMLKKNE